MTGTNETRVVNEATGGAKGSKDEAYSLLPWDQMGEVARLYNFGAQKYDRNNWRKGYDWHLSYDALMRHAAAWWNGEFDDVESGCDHMTSVIFHAFALMYFRHAHPDLDDRPCTVLGSVTETPAPEDVDDQDDLIGWAWSIIANANGGDWDKADPEWKAAAEKWRDTVFPPGPSAVDSGLTGRSASVEPSEPQSEPHALAHVTFGRQVVPRERPRAVNVPIEDPAT